jgi:hypothetical protein
MSLQSDSATIDEFPGYVFFRNGDVKNKNGQLMGYNQNGYIKSSFVDINGKRCVKGLHCLIIRAFSGELPNGREVDHINTIKNDNRYENLQYLTKEEHSKKTHSDNPNMIHLKSQRPVQGIDKDGEIITFNSMKDAALFLEPKKEIKNVVSKITTSIKNNHNYKNYKWSYLDMDSIEGEIWKIPNIDGLESNIQVSNMERLKRENGMITDYRNITTGDYISCGVKINGKNLQRKFHTLVCSAFYGKQPDNMTSVNHIDENKYNNKPENLEWSNPKDQAKTWRQKIYLTKDNKIHEFEGIHEAALFLEISDSSIKRCLSGNMTNVKGYTVTRDEINVRKKRSLGPRNQNGGTAIYQCDENKNIIKEFPTIASAIKEIFPDLELKKYSAKTKGITIAMICGIKSYGYYWLYKNPPKDIDEKKEKERIRCIEKAKKSRANKLLKNEIK